MPFISRFNEKELESFTCYKNDPTGFYAVSTEDGGYAPYHQVKEYTDVFFGDLKPLLEEAATNGLDVTCNEEEKSFTLFGQKFYCFCIESSYSVSTALKDARYSIVPILYKENFVTNPSANVYEGGVTSSKTYSGGSSNHSNYMNETYGYINSTTQVPVSSTYHTNCFIKAFNRYIHDYHLNYSTTTMTGSQAYNAYYTASNNYSGYGEVHDYLGFNQLASLCQNYSTRNTIRYKINVYYNDNYLYVTYKSFNDSYVEEYPIGFFAKGADSFGNEVLFTSLSPSILSTAALSNVTYSPNLSSYTRLCVWSIDTGALWFDADLAVTSMLNVVKTPYVNGYQFFDNSKFAKMKLQALNGLISFENLIVGETTKEYHEFSRGNYYTIDGDTYYVPADAGLDALYPDLMTYNGIFLKM